MYGGSDKGYLRYHLLIAGLFLGIIIVDASIIAHRLLDSSEVGVDRDQIRQISFRLDPNSASAEALSQLPGLNVRQAQSIVEYRERAVVLSGQRVYTSAEDLDAVPGIGAKTLEKIRDYLCFTQPDETDGSTDKEE
jgi:competence ComEA-like helix-hairpin-helix protein